MSFRSISMEEVANHKKLNDVWMVLNGKVYDVSKFIFEHPGGNVIMDGSGRDATALYEEIGHSECISFFFPLVPFPNLSLADASSLLEKMQLGVLSTEK